MTYSASARPRTGSGGKPWVVYDSPKPPPVGDRYTYWAHPPPEVSGRAQWWLRQIDRGWRPPRRIRVECYDCSAEWYGIYIWEYLNLLAPAMGHREEEQL